MSNAMLSYGNLVGQAVLTGGSYQPSLPLSNLKDRVVGIKARTTDLQTTSTRMFIDLQTSEIVRVLAVVGHNLALDAQWRVRGSDTVDGASMLDGLSYDYDSGWEDVWPSVFTTLSLDWNSSNFFHGRYTEAQRKGYTWAVSQVLPRALKCRYWRVEFNDPNNVNGFVDSGRLFLAPAWQPVINISLGASLGWETQTKVTRARSGTKYFDRRTPYRVAKFSTDWMDEGEAMGQAFEIQRQMGVDGEVFYMMDPDDLQNSLRKQFLGTLRDLNPVEYATVIKNRAAWAVEESI